MKAGIMQPYFFPYVGYFHLIAAVDLLIVYDNIKYTKKGWINRNRMLQNTKDVVFSLPLQNDSDFLDVRDRTIAGDFDRTKLLNKIRGAYKRAPYFEQTFPLIDQIVRNEETNLFAYLHNSITKTCAHLGMPQKIMISSNIAIDHQLRGQDKVIALCEAVGAKTYINAIGGMELYSKEIFHQRGIELQFVKSFPFEYPQFGAAFVPNLSIIDVMMFNSLDTIRDRISTNFELI